MSVSVKECDFLEQDPSLRGQNYVCLSFLSPEEVLKNKEIFYLQKYLENFSNDVKYLFENLSIKYPDSAELLNTIKENHKHVFDGETLQDDYSFFSLHNSAIIDEEFYKNNDFKTCIRGIKVRGVFETLKEAEVRAQVLKRHDSKFNVYIAEVGCWCPWSPNPDDIQDSEYAETELNTLMKKYKENQQKKDEFFEERKREKLNI